MQGDDKTYTVYDVVKKLIGEISPVGETNEDNRRFENLQELTKLVDQLVMDIDNVSCKKDSYEHSVKKAGEFAYDFLTNNLGIIE